MKLVLAELVKHQVRNVDVLHDLLVRIDAVGQDDFGYLQAHVHRLADVAVHVQVLKRVLKDGAPHAGLALFGHGVTACDLNFGGLLVGITWAEFHDGMLHIRVIVEGDRPGVKVQVTQNTTQPGR